MMFHTIVARIEKAAAPRGNGNFGCTFTTGIGIITAHWFVFTIAPNLLPIFIAFICCNHNTYFYTICGSNSFHHIDSTHHISGISIYRNLIAQAYKRLGCKVKYYFRLIFTEDCLHALSITNVNTQIGFNFTSNSGKNIIITL